MSLWCFLSALLFATPASASSAGRELATSQQIELARHVVVGTVKRVETGPGWCGVALDFQHVEIAVEETLVGDAAPTLRVRMGVLGEPKGKEPEEGCLELPSQGCCRGGVPGGALQPLEVGTRALFVVHQDRGEPVVNEALGSVVLEDGTTWWKRKKVGLHWSEMPLPDKFVLSFRGHDGGFSWLPTCGASYCAKEGEGVPLDSLDAVRDQLRSWLEAKAE